VCVLLVTLGRWGATSGGRSWEATEAKAQSRPQAGRSHISIPCAFTERLARDSADWHPVTAIQPGSNRTQTPSPRYCLGTDDLRRDIFSQVVHGSRTCLGIGLASALLAASVGILIGSLAGYYGGWLDDVLMHVTEMVPLVPRFFLAILVSALFGPSLRHVDDLEDTAVGSYGGRSQQHEGRQYQSRPG
jgi:ABC-type dipeptide/oligopeptide/nickel transport system permease subunit